MLQAAFEVVVESVLYPVFEFVIRRPGYWVLRCFYPASKVAVDGDAATLAGLMLLAVVGGMVALILLA